MPFCMLWLRDGNVLWEPCWDHQCFIAFYVNASISSVDDCFIHLVLYDSRAVSGIFSKITQKDYAGIGHIKTHACSLSRQYSFYFRRGPWIHCGDPSYKSTVHRGGYPRLNIWLSLFDDVLSCGCPFLLCPRQFESE